MIASITSPSWSATSPPVSRFVAVTMSGVPSAANVRTRSRGSENRGPPRLGELAGRRAPCHTGSVDGADGGAHDQVEPDPQLDEPAIEPDLDRAPAAASAQDERRHRSARAAGPRRWMTREAGAPGADVPSRVVRLVLEEETGLEPVRPHAARPPGTGADRKGSGLNLLSTTVKGSVRSYTRVHRQLPRQDFPSQDARHLFTAR